MGSRLDDKRVSAAVAWWGEVHTLPPSTGETTGAVYRPIRRPVGCTGGPFHLGTSSEVVNAEVYALDRTMRIIDSRAEQDQRDTVSSNSTAVVTRVESPRPAVRSGMPRGLLTHRGPGQHSDHPMDPRTPGATLEDNEMADLLAQAAAENRTHAVYGPSLRKTSLSHMAGMTEIKSRAQRSG